MPLQWYAGGKDRPQLRAIVWNAFKEFGMPLELDPSPTPPASDMSYFYRFVPGVDTSEYHNYFHTDWETPEVVPWTGLEAATRAYAKVIDEVNKHAAERAAASRGHVARPVRLVKRGFHVLLAHDPHQPIGIFDAFIELLDADALIAPVRAVLIGVDPNPAKIVAWASRSCAFVDRR